MNSKGIFLFICGLFVLKLEVEVKMYQLIRLLNNNAALVKTQNGEQVIVMGLGVAFQKKKGDVINQDKVEKVFSIKNDENRENFLTLLKDIPFDFVTVTFEVIDELVKNYHYPVQNYIYVTLTDHLFCAYKTLQNNTYQNSRLPDLSHQYPVEHEMARIALTKFTNQLKIHFPKDELERIALHFINAKGEDLEVVQNVVNDSSKLIALIKDKLKSYGITRKYSNSNYYDRLMIHLSYFLNFLDRNDQINNSIINLEHNIKTEYPKAYSIGNEIYHLIDINTDKKLFEGEKLYIVLHLQRLLEGESNE